MKTMKRVLCGLSLASAVSLGGCGGDGGAGDDDPAPDATAGPDAPGTGQTIRVTADITADTTWTAGNTYVLPRLTYRFVQPGATLTIEPGARIEGEQGAVLVITRGARIVADGTREAPIVMTSRQPNTPGYWGGLLVLGAAPINNNVNSMPPSTEAVFEAFTSSVPEGRFGGTDPDDSSGVLRYVRVEFCGFNFVADREFNNITFAGVGAGTTVEYVQAHGGLDDGVELFGGTVNLRYVVSSQNGDDGFDTDNGWQGKAQFVVVQNVNPQGETEASNGYESDNHGTAASYTAEPRTFPTVSNVTIIGRKDYTTGTSWAAVHRRGAGGRYYNHLVVDFQRGVEFRDAATLAQLEAGNLFYQGSIFWNNGPDGTSLPPPQAMGDIDEATYLDASSRDNRRGVDPMLPASRASLTAPSFQPMAGSPALTCGAPPSDPFFDQTATFCGAIGDDDWTAGWTAYPQPQ